MQSVLITGCRDHGIGSALVTCFIQRGYCVFATARNLKSMSKLAGLANVRLLEMDILDADQIKAVTETVQQETGGALDYLINNAGQNRFMPLLDENIEEVKKQFDINMIGHLRVTQALAPLLMAAKGTVVFNSSVSGYINVPWQGIYAASKRAMEVMADTLRLELAPFQVKVTSFVTTAVKSKTQSHHAEWKMPKTSYFSAVEQYFDKRAKGDDGAPRMNATQYAEGVVSEILRGSKTKFFYGASAGVIKFVVGWLPPTWLAE